ncbi:SusC/RagA family TonB-linked outer membrane protein [Natronoflexus pectinivorans]|uniref:TonB-linked SusC/RagA family outer membrane protein n=1 Tax=Natronoflexus pectinivorans TaxID=682526 RepID=A0A4R2GN22_9BACT|nr:TonB-dependent receptor [Natronoflexus pectinivorans]TCO10692.1 TonB-linked SusC/RagA family outer membrane protein [Natronoflexus pectinivorans]
MKKINCKLACLFLLPLLLLTVNLNAQQGQIQGRVVDEAGFPIAGVNVIIQGTTTGVITDSEGNYRINAAPDAILSFSFIGYSSETIPVDGRTQIDLTLTPDVLQLSDIVVVGYGTQRRESLTGSVASISSDRLERKPVSSIESALQGEMSGVSVVSSGGPGEAPSVRIRGIGSVNFSADPLYVIDGIPVGNLNNFDVNDIESVSVLKDAAASAIYGSRAANGVVLITTKRGSRDGRVSINVDASTGFQQAWNKLDLLNRDEYMAFATDLLTNAGLALPTRFSNMNAPIYEGATQTFAQTDTDWQDEMFRTAGISRVNIDLSGGNEQYRFYTSYGRFQQDGIMVGSDFDRHSFRINSEYKVNNFLTVGESIKASYSTQSREIEQGGRTIIKHMVNQVPYIPVYNPTNLGGFGGPEPVDGSDAENPVQVATHNNISNRVVNLVGNAYARIAFTDWLSFRSAVGIEYSGTRITEQRPMYNNGYNQRNYNELSDDRSRYYSRIFTNQLNFDRIIDRHEINAVAIVEEQITSNDFLIGRGQHTTNSLDQLQGTSSQTVSGGLNETALISYAGRLNYAFDDKYLLSASFRRDGSSVFAPGKKWGNFPGASLGWVMSREDFMQDFDFLSELKFRASYGTLGFNAVGAYPWQSTIAFNTWAVLNDNASNNQGAYFSVLPNQDLEWEITTMSNFGFDLSLFHHAVTFSAEYYMRRVDNLIVENPLAPSMGYSSDPLTNIGEMKNWGYDFNLGYNKRDGEFRFGISANLSTVNNEVVRLSTGAPFIDIGATTEDYGGGSITRTQAGHPIQGFYGYVVDGIFQTQAEIDALNNIAAQQYAAGIVDQQYYQSEFTAPGDIRFRDLTGNGIVDENDRQIIGNFLPDFSYGINFNAEYRNFDLSLLIQGVYGNDIYNGTAVLTQGMMRLFNMDKAVLDAWTPNNTNTDMPRAISGDPNRNARVSDRFVEDGSYMRLKNLTLGYNISDEVLASTFRNSIRGVRLYVTAQNLLTITNYSGYDPEIASYGNNTLRHGVDLGQYPQPRTFIFGVRASF